ncbi:MAG: hypothetical protein U5L96_17415 [Owenweeksia sp.]|nr:hypothetical protein [Owenweeksia sp.]
MYTSISNGQGSLRQVGLNLYLNEACQLDTVSFSRENFSCSDIGTIKVALTAIDGEGNRKDDSINVDVLDTIPPSLVNQNLTVYLDGSGTATITTNDVNQLTADVCGVDTLYLDQYNFACADVGVNTVTLTAVDLNGTMGTGTAQVTGN